MFWRADEAAGVRGWATERRWLCVLAVAAIGGCLATSLWGSLGDLFPSGDYPGPPCNGCDSAGPPLAFLVHGHPSGFFTAQPFQGSVSLLLRAPFVGLIAWTNGTIDIQYRVGTLVLMLSVVALLLPAVKLMLRRGQHPLIILVTLAAILVGPAMLKALRWGHPEELLGAALAVAAVLAAVHRRGVAAGVFLGLAVATKQWGVFAVLPVLMLAPGLRRQVGLTATIVAAVFIVPMFVGDPTRFLDQNFHTGVAQLGVEPTNVWWPLHRAGFDPSIHQPLEVIPTFFREISHPLALMVALGLSLLYWRRNAGRHPYDAVGLLALLFLIRCALDPLTISYHHVPFMLSVAIWEGLSRRGIPMVTLTSTALILILGTSHTLESHQDVMNIVYLAWLFPTLGYLIHSLFGQQIKLPRLDQPAVAGPIVAA